MIPHVPETQMTVSLATVIALVGVMITFAIALAQVVFRTGRLDARVEQLEEWRKNVRGDLGEVSTELRGLQVEVRGLRTIIEERTSKHRSTDSIV